MPWLSPTVFFQEAEIFEEIPAFNDGAESVNFQHVVHLYRDRHSEYNTQVQQVTFESIRRARDFFDPGGNRVRLRAVVFPDERDIVPADMKAVPNLTRTVGDFASFAVPRMLPLLFDILSEGISDQNEPDGMGGGREFVVFTNSDIHLMPHFYASVAALIHRGFDSLIINRRTISRFNPDPGALPLMYSEVGKDHPGLDCFVFPKERFVQFVRSNACVGAAFVMRSLLYNLVAFSNRMLVMKRAHLTFHLGDDKFWKDPKLQDYTDFNAAETFRVISSLCSSREVMQRLHPFAIAFGHPLEIQHLAKIPR